LTLPHSNKYSEWGSLHPFILEFWNSQLGFYLCQERPSTAVGAQPGYKGLELETSERRGLFAIELIISPLRGLGNIYNN
jgi:hypothetical protein